MQPFPSWRRLQGNYCNYNSVLNTCKYAVLLKAKTMFIRFFFLSIINWVFFFFFFCCTRSSTGFPGGTVVKSPLTKTGNGRDIGSIPGLGRCPGIGNGNPLQYYCLENSMDRGAWQATVHGVAKSRTLLNEYIHTWNRPEETYHGLSGLGRR